MRCTLTVDDGTVLVKGDYNHSGIYIDGPYSKISIKNNAHVEAPTIVGNTYYSRSEARRYRRHADL